MSIRKKFFIRRILIFYGVVLVPIVFISTFLYGIIRHNLEETINDRAHALLLVTRSNLEQIMDVTSNIQSLYNHNPDLYVTTSAMLSRDTLDYHGLITYKYMSYLLRYPTQNNQSIHSVYLYIENQQGRFLNSNDRILTLDRFADRGWYESYLTHRTSQKMWVESRSVKSHSFELEDAKMITIYQPILGGVVAANVKRDSLSKLLRQYQHYPDELLLITTGENELLFSNEDAFYENPPVLPVSGSEITLNGQEYIANQQESGRFNLRYWSLVPKNTLYAVSKQLFHYTLLALLGSLGVTFFCAYFSTHRNFKRLSDIIDLFDHAEQGIALPPLSDPARDEYGLLLHNVLRTFVNQSYLKLQLSERKYRQQAAELAALQLQINPHFLFNTLQTIDFEIVKGCGESAAASVMLQQLCALLKYSLNAPDSPVTFGEEIAHAKEYCGIQKYRYEDRFHVFWDYPPVLLNCRVCRLILQPLIENSLYHGVKPKTDPGLIRVMIRIKGSIHVRVTDNGVGMEKERLRELRRRLLVDEDSPGDGTNIGLVNTSRRLVLTFGPESRLQIFSRKGLGTVVSFVIPCVR